MEHTVSIIPLKLTKVSAEKSSSSPQYAPKKEQYMGESHSNTAVHTAMGIRSSADGRSVFTVEIKIKAKNAMTK